MHYKNIFVMMKYEEILNIEEDTPTLLSEQISAQSNSYSTAVCDSLEMCGEDIQIVSQRELDAECYTLAESKSRLKAMVYAHFHNV